MMGVYFLQVVRYGSRTMLKIISLQLLSVLEKKEKVHLNTKILSLV